MHVCPVEILALFSLIENRYQLWWSFKNMWMGLNTTCRCFVCDLIHMKPSK
jgi:hypothetical protein